MIPHWQYIALIYHLYTTFWGGYMLPPFMGTRNNHSPPRRSFASQKLLNVNSPRHTNNPPHQCGPHYLASGKYHANGPQWETKKTRSVFQFLWLKLTPSLQYLSGWWLNQPHWKICSSKRVHLPQIGVKFKKMKPPPIVIIFQLLFIYTLLLNQSGFSTPEN